MALHLFLAMSGQKLIEAKKEKKHLPIWRHWDSRTTRKNAIVLDKISSLLLVHPVMHLYSSYDILRLFFASCPWSQGTGKDAPPSGIAWSVQTQTPAFAHKSLVILTILARYHLFVAFLSCFTI